MKIALLGGTGPTGRHIIEEALRQGYKLSVYTRDAGKLSAFGSKIEVIIGDLNNREAIKASIAGSDAVISALGPNSLKAREKRPIMRGASIGRWFGFPTSRMGPQQAKWTLAGMAGRSSA